MTSQQTDSTSTPQRALTRAEVYQLTVFWFQQPDTPAARGRLFAAGQALGRPMLDDAQRDAREAPAFDDEDGCLLATPWIDNPDAVCAEFEPTPEERSVLDALYRQATDHALNAVDALRRILGRWPKVA